jgi:ADP-ribosylation factor-like protein 2
MNLILGDVGGQRTLRPYWRNYFEQTDAIVWVVDSGDRMRMQDCKEELHDLLQEDVRVQTVDQVTCLNEHTATGRGIPPRFCQ